MVYLIVLGTLGLSTIGMVMIKEHFKNKENKETLQDEAPKQRKSKVYI